MTCRIYLLILIVYHLAVRLIAGQESCAPSFVRGISVSDELILEWTPPPGNDCEISHYLIYILSRGEQTVYTSVESSLDVSFLPTCEDAQFTVIPVSTEAVEGATVTLHMQLPVPRDANVTVGSIRISPQSGGSLLLTWELEEEWQHCTNRFRVLIYNEDYDEAVDIYVQTTSALLHHIMPCEDYTFGVRAIHSLIREGPIFLIRYTTLSAIMAAPTLQSYALETTSVDLEWQFEIFTHNRCAVSSIVIDSSPYFTVSYPVRDDPERPILSTKVTGLQPDTMYFLNVTVINAAGPSVPALIAIQTLPED